MIHGAAERSIIAVQLAKAKGAHVIGSGRSKVKSLVLDLGADEFVDVEQDRGRRRQGHRRCLRHDRRRRSRPVRQDREAGRRARRTSPPQADRDDMRSIFFIRDPNRAQLIEIAQLVDAGKLTPQVGAVYPLAQAREAFTAKSGGGIPGRIVLQP